MPEPAAALRPGAIRHSFADVNGVRLHYASVGAGRLILFLHGFPEFWYVWRNQLADLGRDFLAVAPDLRGYNFSSKPAEVEQYSVKFLVGDVCALIQHLGAQKCCLVGHDWGGVVAWAVAMAVPEAVEKLVIINAPHPAIFDRELHENPAQQQASQYMLLFRSAQAETILSANKFAYLQEAVLGESLRRGYVTEADRQAYLEAWSQPGALTGGLNYYRAAAVGPPSQVADKGFDLRARFPSLEVNAPTLVIWGEMDPFLLTGNLDGLGRYVPNLSMERIPDATHWVIHEKPDLVNSLIRHFLSP